MPWAKIGRTTLDLDRVEVVVEGVMPENGLSVTIKLMSGREEELVGQDAKVFLDLFAMYTASRAFGLPPPREPTIGTGNGALTGDAPDRLVGVEPLGLVN